MKSTFSQRTSGVTLLNMRSREIQLQTAGLDYSRRHFETVSYITDIMFTGSYV